MIIPKHVAFIMDGNGRWATERGLPRSAGHKAGYEHILLWQSAFAVVYVAKNYWPAITRKDIESGISHYNRIMIKITS